MNSSIQVCLTLIKHGRASEQFPLTTGTNTVGRDKSNTVPIADPSVSRRHAEISINDKGITVRDLATRNGTKVNGVPRRQATLQLGDRVSFGAVDFLFGEQLVRPAAPSLAPAPNLGQEVALDQTRRHSLRLPEQRAERHLAAFYHLCAWVTEGVDEAEGQDKFLELLLESLNACAVHRYEADNRLGQVTKGDVEAPRVKFAPYLLEKFRQLPEVTAYAPRELDRFQQRLGNYQYAVAPLRSGPSSGGPCPVIVAMRPADWEPFSPEERVLFQSACQLWLRSGTRATEVRELKRENEDLRKQTLSAGPALLGGSAAMEKLRARIERVAATKATVLITGETGSGKELVAHALHRNSPRSNGPFIKVNCAAIPGALMESELFGHVRGAFTDARTDHKGKFLLAHCGTLFLDEIGEVPLVVQSKLLRALETGEIERLGSERTDNVDVRILAATNRDLREQVRSGAFREDLLYRLEVAKIEVPRLRDHATDIDELAPAFLRQFSVENGLAELTLAPDGLAALRKHKWPGNVRELRNVVQRLAMDAESSLIGAPLVRQAIG